MLPSNTITIILYPHHKTIVRTSHSLLRNPGPLTPLLAVHPHQKDVRL